MISKVFILISLGIYIVLASWNVSQKDSHFLIERLFKILKHLYCHLFY